MATFGLLPATSASVIERMARAIYESDPRCDARGVPIHWEDEALATVTRLIVLGYARSALGAAIYSDWDEEVLIAVSNEERIEAVSLAGAWDALIHKHLEANP